MLFASDHHAVMSNFKEDTSLSFPTKSKENSERNKETKIIASAFLLPSYIGCLGDKVQFKWKNLK